MMHSTIFTCFLKELGVKFTTSFSDKLFSEHPFKYSLFGISNLLTAYHVPNVGIKLNKSDISQLSVPFIAHTGTDFVVVKEVTSDRISYIWRRKYLHSSIDNFKEIWTGVILLAEPNELFSEPEYKKHWKQQSYYDVNQSVSKIILGNPSASLAITILTNTHCEPCAKMHKRISTLLEAMEDKLYVQYIFSSFNDSLVRSSRFLIAAYFQSNEMQVKDIYSNWFEKEKYFSEAYISKFEFQMTSTNVDIELAKHERWKVENHIAATPTILINGYKLPENYKIEDLEYLIDIEIN